MSTPACRLCQRRRELRDSHFIPAGFYRLVEPDGRAPIIINRQHHVQTNAQARGHLLCEACERRLNENGEDWVLANCCRSAANFPLREALLRAVSMGRSGRATVYAGASIPGVDVDKLAYFAASIFWRGYLTGWRSSDRHVPVVPLELGPYAEGLRRFLLGELGFPADVVLMTAVSAVPAPTLAVSFPYGGRIQRHFAYRFLVPGIVFDLLVGKSLPMRARDSCCAASAQRPIFLRPDAEADELDAARRLFATGVPMGKLRHT